MRQPDDWTEAEANEAQMLNRINELEVELKTAKVDGIKEAVEECQFNFMGDITLKACLVSSLLKYAKEL